MSTHTTPHPPHSVFEPRVVEELERFAAGYDALCEELFDHDPVLSTRIARRHTPRRPRPPQPLNTKARSFPTPQVASLQQSEGPTPEGSAMPSSQAAANFDAYTAKFQALLEAEHPGRVTLLHK